MNVTSETDQRKKAQTTRSRKKRKAVITEPHGSEEIKRKCYVQLRPTGAMWSLPWETVVWKFIHEE